MLGVGVVIIGVEARRIEGIGEGDRGDEVGGIGEGDGPEAGGGVGGAISSSELSVSESSESMNFLFAILL